MKNFFKFFGLIALCATAFASCQKEPFNEEIQTSEAPEAGGTRASYSHQVVLMTYNIEHFGFNATTKPQILANMDNIAALIAQNATHNPRTFISFNEVDYKTNRTFQQDQLGLFYNKMHELTNYSWHRKFGKAITFQGGQYGNGVVYNESSSNVTQTLTETLSNHGYKKDDGGNEETRNATIVETNECVFIATHLGLSKKMRQRNLLDLDAWLKNRYSHSSKPVFVCGDFNSNYKVAEDKQLIDNLVAGKYTNPETGETVNGSAWKILSNTTDATFYKGGRVLDYILQWRGNIATNQAHIAKIISNQNFSNYNYSDHKLVMVKVGWN